MNAAKIEMKSGNSKKQAKNAQLATSFVFWCHLDINDRKKYGIL